MSQAAVIAQLSAVFPDWRQELEVRTGLAIETLRWRARCGKLFADQDVYSATYAMLNERAAIMVNLADRLSTMPLNELATPKAVRRKKLSMRELQAAVRPFDPNWNFKLGFPRGFLPWLIAQGYEHAGNGVWYAPITKT